MRTELCSTVMSQEEIELQKLRLALAKIDRILPLLGTPDIPFNKNLDLPGQRKTRIARTTRKLQNAKTTLREMLSYYNVQQPGEYLCDIAALLEKPSVSYLPPDQPHLDAALMGIFTLNACTRQENNDLFSVNDRFLALIGKLGSHLPAVESADIESLSLGEIKRRIVGEFRQQIASPIPLWQKGDPRRDFLDCLRKTVKNTPAFFHLIEQTPVNSDGDSRVNLRLSLRDLFIENSKRVYGSDYGYSKLKVAENLEETTPMSTEVQTAQPDTTEYITTNIAASKQLREAGLPIPVDQIEGLIKNFKQIADISALEAARQRLLTSGLKIPTLSPLTLRLNRGNVLALANDVHFKAKERNFTQDELDGVRREIGVIFKKTSPFKPSL